MKVEGLGAKDPMLVSGRVVREMVFSRIASTYT